MKMRPGKVEDDTAQLRTQMHGIRKLAEAHGWQGERDAKDLCAFLADQLRVGSIAQTCTVAPSAKGAPAWGCYDCGFSGAGFRTLVQGGGQFEAECPDCGSRHTDEAGTVLRELVALVDTLREQQAAAGLPAASTSA